MANRLSNDFQFIDVGRQDPQKKDARTRSREFAEIYEPFKPMEAASQALQLDPSSSHALFRGAQAAYGLGDLVQAVSFCDRLVGSTDEDVMALQKRVR